MIVVDRMFCKYLGVWLGGLVNIISMLLSVVNSFKVKIIFREDINFNVMELLMKCLVKRVVNINIILIIMYEFSNKIKVFLLILFIVLVNIGRFIFIVILENMFKIVNIMFCVVFWKWNVFDVLVVLFFFFWDLFLIFFFIRGGVFLWFMLWIEMRYIFLEFDIFFFCCFNEYYVKCEKIVSVVNYFNKFRYIYRDERWFIMSWDNLILEYFNFKIIWIYLLIVMWCLFWGWYIFFNYM